MSAPTIHGAAPAAAVDQLFYAAFSTSRDPRSGEYMDGARAALAYRIDGERIGAPHQVGTAAADAFFAGIEEGHAIWRRASGTAAPASASASSTSTAPPAATGQLLNIETYAVDIGAQVTDIEILLQSVFEKLDNVGDAGAAAGALAAINCFTTCALRNAALIGEAKDHIIALATEGGAA